MGGNPLILQVLLLASPLACLPPTGEKEAPSSALSQSGRVPPSERSRKSGNGLASFFHTRLITAAKTSSSREGTSLPRSSPPPNARSAATDNTAGGDFVDQVSQPPQPQQQRRRRPSVGRYRCFLLVPPQAGTHSLACRREPTDRRSKHTHSPPPPPPPLLAPPSPPPLPTPPCAQAAARGGGWAEADPPHNSPLPLSTYYVRK